MLSGVLTVLGTTLGPLYFFSRNPREGVGARLKLAQHTQQSSISSSRIVPQDYVLRSTVVLVGTVSGAVLLHRQALATV